MRVIFLLILFWLRHGGSVRTVGDTKKAGEHGEFPYVVLVWFKDQIFCAGTILTDRWVITMAQCCIDTGVSCLGFVVTGGISYKKDFEFDQVSATTYKIMSAIRYILSIDCNREPMLVKTYSIIGTFEYAKPIPTLDEIKLPLNATAKCVLISWEPSEDGGGFVQVSSSFEVRSMAHKTNSLQWKNAANSMYTESEQGRVCEGQLGASLVCNDTLVGVAAGRVNKSGFVGMDGECSDKHDYYTFLYTGYYSRWIKWHASDVVIERKFFEIAVGAHVATPRLVVVLATSLSLMAWAA